VTILIASSNSIQSESDTSAAEADLCRSFSAGLEGLLHPGDQY